MERRKRRSFTEEFKAEAVRLAREGTKSLPQLAKDLNLTESALRQWVHQADQAEGKPTFQIRCSNFFRVMHAPWRRAPFYLPTAFTGRIGRGGHMGAYCMGLNTPPSALAHTPGPVLQAARAVPSAPQW